MGIHKKMGSTRSNKPPLLELAAFGGQGETEAGFPPEPWKRCEFHRNAVALLPDEHDRNPGVAYMVFNPQGLKDQRFCTCSISRKRTCPHLLELSDLLRQLNRTSGLLDQYERFEKSLWRQLATVLYEDGGGCPSPLLIGQGENGDADFLRVRGREGKPVLVYLSGGEDRSRFLERCGPGGQESEVPGRDDVLKRLALLTLTDSERQLMDRGFLSRRQAVEQSFWYALAYHAFREVGSKGCTLMPAIEEKSGLFSVTCSYREKDAIFRLFVPRRAVEKVIRVMGEHLPNQNRLPIHPVPLRTLFKVDMNTEMDLEIRPVIQMLQDHGEDRFFEREDLDRFIYGRLVYLPEMGLMAEMEREDKVRRFAAPRKMVLRRSQVPTYLDSIGEDGGSEVHLLGPEVKRLKILRTPDRIEIIPDAMDREWCWLSVSYGFGNESISLAEILETRKRGQRYLALPGGWVDCESTAIKKMAEPFHTTQADMESENPLKFSKMELLRLGATAMDNVILRGEIRRKEILEDLLQLRPRRSELPLEGLVSTLRSYQRAGVHWLWFLYENGLGGLLCDDMGLGKTHQVMALMVAILEEEEPDARFLVVCPTTVLGHWERKLKEHAPVLGTASYHGVGRDFKAAMASGRVILTSYGMLRNDIDLFREFEFTLAAFDEIQYIKNSETRGYRAALDIRAGMKLGMTGTPVENDLKELKNLMDLTVPGYLGSDGAFAARYVQPIQENRDPSRREELSRLISPFTLRRHKRNVLKELPEKIEDTRFCRLSEDQVALYREAIDMRGKGLLDKLNATEDPVPYIHIFALLNLLKQICNHPALVEGGEGREFREYRSGKWDLFQELLVESVESGQKVVVYSQYLGMIRLFEELVKEMGVGYVSLTGRTRKRGEVIDRFNDDPSCRYFSGKPHGRRRGDRSRSRIGCDPL